MVVTGKNPASEYVRPQGAVRHESQYSSRGTTRRDENKDSTKDSEDKEDESDGSDGFWGGTSSQNDGASSARGRGLKILYA